MNINNITEYEFNTIMEYFREKTTSENYNPNNIIKIIKKNDLYNESSYRILGTPEFDITRNSVRGKIPAEIIFELYNKYSNDGIFKYPLEVLIDEFVDDELLETREKVANMELTETELINLLIQEYDEFYERENKSKYLEYFEFPTKEVLIDFIIEIINYNRKIRNLNLLSDNDYKTIMYSIKTNIIESSNPNIITSRWLSKIDYTTNEFNIDKRIRQKLNELDNTINPFLSSNILLNNIKYYDDILNITTDVRDKNYTRFNNLTMLITKIDDNKHVSYKRNEYEISFEVFGNLNGNYMHLEHKYENDKEILTCKLTGENYLYIEYNVNDNTIFKTNESISSNEQKEFTYVNKEELNFLLNKLDELINYTKTITLDNMTNNREIPNTKKLTNK